MSDYVPGYQCLPNYERPELVPQPKSYKAERKAKQRTADRQFALTRAQVRAIVMDRAHGCCERCGRKVDFDCAPYLDHHAEVNENPPRSLGGDPLDPNQCVLLCKSCHFSQASGGHIGRMNR
jgi:hypothetical protein